MKELVVEVKPRDTGGKNASRRLRRQGLIPAVIYGARRDPRPVIIDPRRLLEILHSDTGANTLFQVTLEGTDRRRHVMIKDYQVDPVKGDLIHVDLLRVAMDEVIEVDVPIQISGEAAGVKLDGGILEHVTRKVRVSCLPGDIPDHLTIDVSALKIGDNLRVSDLPKSERFKVLEEADQILVVVSPPAKEEVPVVATETVAAPAEPEVIKKGKAAVEGEGEPGGEAEEDKGRKEARKPEGKK